MLPPNIILITADQLRWDCLGFAGNPDVRTPNLDNLAAHAVHFEQAICQQALCVPSRSTILTGQRPRTHGVVDNRDSLRPDAVTFAHLLRNAGYQTAAVGKMHFNPTRAPYGIDTLVLAEQDGPGRNDDDYHAWLKEHNRIDRIDVWDQVDRAQAPIAYWHALGALPSNLPESMHATTWTGDQGVRFLQRRAREPFFLWASFIKPHHPFDPPRPWDRLYDPAALTLPAGFTLPVPEYDAKHGGFFDPKEMTEARFRRVLALYYANISHMDQQIGRLLATLTARGHTNNLIVFASDHGDYMGQHGLITKKHNQVYDSLLRTPLLVAGMPGQRRGERDPALAELTDIFPTFLELAGVPVPETCEGTSLVPCLREPGHTLRAAACAEDPRRAMYIARTATHKLLETPDPDFRALYDLTADPHEFENRYGDPAYEAVQRDLAAQLAP
ncbi:MAG: sulfatase [Candidatus Hydrogenedentota bacterium]